MTWEIVAQPYMDLQGPHHEVKTPLVEGPSFAADGSLVFVSVFGDSDGNGLLRADLDSRTVTPLCGDRDANFAGTAIHPDGRVFIADLGLKRRGGRILSFDPKRSQLVTVVADFEGTTFYPDDLVFDHAGNLYFNDMQGTIVNPTGRVFRLSIAGDLALVTGGLIAPNGIAFDHTGTALWNSEHFANRLVKINLGPDGLLADGLFPDSSIRVYTHLSGGEVDSLTVDSEGNVYAAMYHAGRIDVVDKTGKMLGSVSLGEYTQRLPSTSHVVIRPGTREGFILASGPEGARLFAFEALAPAQKLFAQTS